MTPYVVTAFMANSAISLFSVRVPTPETLRALNAALSEAIIVTCEHNDAPQAFSPTQYACPATTIDAVAEPTGSPGTGGTRP